MKKISFYSYKGGTGRTVATANIAMALARRGKNVICIDLDVDGPGLDIVFGLGNRVQNSIQDYLWSPNEYSPLDLLLEVRAEDTSERSGFVKLVPASLEIEKPLNLMGDTTQIMLEDFLRELEGQVNPPPDFVLVDSASGYTEMAAISMSLVDLVLVFFRWSQQHLIGTYVISKFFEHLRTEKGHSLEFELVANDLPQIQDKSMENAYSQNIQLLETETGKKLFGAIQENASLKWKDRVLEKSSEGDSKTIEEFEHIAGKILNPPNSKGE